VSGHEVLPPMLDKGYSGHNPAHSLTMKGVKSPCSLISQYAIEEIGD
jgi:hypothetical protein